MLCTHSRLASTHPHKTVTANFTM